MATHDYVIANGTGAAVRADLNNALAAIVSNNSSSTEPGTTYAYQWWADTNANVLKIRNSANDGWITLKELDGTLRMEDGSAGAPALTFNSDTDTGIYRPSDNEIAVTAAGVERMSVSNTSIIVNEGSNDYDFRVESDGQTHMLFINGGNNTVGIASSSPAAAYLHVGPGSTVTPDGNADDVVIDAGAADTGLSILSTSTGRIYFGDAADDEAGSIRYVHGDNSLRFEANSSESFRIDSSQRLLLGTSASPSSGQGQYSNLVALGGAGTTYGNISIGSTSAATSLSSGDNIGVVCFTDNDGNEFVRVSSAADAAPGSGDYPGRLVVSTTADAASSPTERLRFTSGGKIQVTGTRGGTLQASDNDSLELYTSATSGNVSTGGGITFYNHHGNGHVMGGVIHVVKANGVYENSSSDMLFGTRVSGSAVAYRARLTSVGDWQTFSTNVNIDIANSQSSGNNEAFIYARYGSTGLGAGTLSFRVYTNGNVQNTNNSYGSISDQNLKENIIDATSQWDDIKALQVRKYNFREDTGHQTHTQLGLIAQEVETVSPGLVETTDVREGETVLDADGNQLESIKSINYSVLYMKAVKALQEAMDRIETLETKVAALEAG